MASCPKCGAEVSAQAATCAACGTNLATRHSRPRVGMVYSHVPHPYIELRKSLAPRLRQIKPGGAAARFNKFLGTKITKAVGTMWCAYAFAALALVSLPQAIAGGTAPLIAWIAQTFIQLVLLSIIMVGQNIAGEATDKRAIATYNDAEALLHEAMQIQQHLEAQDAFLQKISDEFTDARPSVAASHAGTPAEDHLAPPTG